MPKMSAMMMRAGAGRGRVPPQLIARGAMQGEARQKKAASARAAGVDRKGRGFSLQKLQGVTKRGSGVTRKTGATLPISANQNPVTSTNPGNVDPNPSPRQHMTGYVPAAKLNQTLRLQQKASARPLANVTAKKVTKSVRGGSGKSSSSFKTPAPPQKWSEEKKRHHKQAKLKTQGRSLYKPTTERRTYGPQRPYLKK